MSEIISCTHKVTLDIAKRDVHMIQVIYGDTANILEVNLCENGKEISLENATLATITYSNDTFDEMQISEDYRTASVRINANCLKQGLNFAQISIYSGDNGLITADMLTIDCNQKIGSENPSCPNADMPKLKELINQLIQQGMADGISPEQIADAVANYLTENPIEETDPNVHEWAKAEEKPTYTAEEVGALSEKTLKPAVSLALAQAKASGEFDGADGKSAYQYAQDGGYTGTEAEFAEKMAAEMPTTLPNPNALTFTGAVTGSYDGSATLTVNIPNGGKSETWEVIADQTLTEDVTIVEYDNLSLKKVMIDIFAVSSAATTKTQNGSVSVNGNAFFYSNRIILSKDFEKGWAQVYAECINDTLYHLSNSNNNNTYQSTQIMKGWVDGIEKIEKITISAPLLENMVIGAGTRIRVLGVSK